MVLPLLGLLGSAVGTAGRMGMMGGQAMAGAAPRAGQLAAKAVKGTTGPGMGKKVTNALINGPKRMYKLQTGMKKFAQKSLGLNLSIASIMKQSQLFTGFLGAIFQVIGAIVDAFLAPMMPTLFKLVVWMAKGVPKAAAAGQAIADWIGAFFSGGFKNALIMVKDLFLNSIKGLAKLLWAGVKGLWSILTNKDYWKAIGKGLLTLGKAILMAYFNYWKLYFTTLYVKLPKLVWGLLKSKLPWLQKVEDWLNNFVSNLGEGFKSGWDAMINWFSSAWKKLQLFVAQFQLGILKGLNKIWRVDLDSQVADAQANVARLKQAAYGGTTSTQVTVIIDGQTVLSEDNPDGTLHVNQPANTLSNRLNGTGSTSAFRNQFPFG